MKTNKIRLASAIGYWISVIIGLIATYIQIWQEEMIIEGTLGEKLLATAIFLAVWNVLGYLVYLWIADLDNSRGERKF